MADPHRGAATVRRSRGVAEPARAGPTQRPSGRGARAGPATASRRRPARTACVDADPRRPADARPGITRSSVTATRARPHVPIALGGSDPLGAAPTAVRGYLGRRSGAPVASPDGRPNRHHRGAQVRGGFNIGVIVAAVLAILAVRRSAMFPIVIAPPLVYTGIGGDAVLPVGRPARPAGPLRRGGQLAGLRFPAIAAATAAVLVIAGIRLVSGAEHSRPLGARSSWPARPAAGRGAAPAAARRSAAPRCG